MCQNSEVSKFGSQVSKFGTWLYLVLKSCIYTNWFTNQLNTTYFYYDIITFKYNL